MIVSERALKSFQVSYVVTQDIKPHSIVENLKLPAAIERVKSMFGEGEDKKNSIPFADNSGLMRLQGGKRAR